MDLILKQWIEASVTDRLDSLHFCSNIGVVYIGIKPCAILSVSAQELALCTQLSHNLRLVVLKKRQDRHCLLVYHPQQLTQTLSRKSVLRHLQQLGYDKTFQLERYVATLCARIRTSGDFPHEIGFFLGYPIKDVLGYMGLADVPFAKAMGWRMYGNTDSSEQLYHQVKQAKQAIITFAKQTQVC